MFESVNDTYGGDDTICVLEKRQMRVDSRFVKLTESE